ncbi:hypothetical protein H2P46_19530 [Mixta sp. Marseille-Q2057]|nr:hypothetical protein [Mixta mediterraneensis]
MSEKHISYNELSAKTSISVSRLRRCLEQWSDQSMTLSDLGKIYHALGITSDLNKHPELLLLSDEAKTQLCAMIKIIKTA